VASRPLRLEELVEILAFNLNAGPIPKSDVGCRLEGPVEAVLSICSTLLSLISVEHSRVVQIGHLLVKEFLTSPRFAPKLDTISSHYHISMSPAHTFIAQACLGILLHLPETVTKDSLMHYILAEHTAKHWFEHGPFRGDENNSLSGRNHILRFGSGYVTRHHRPGSGGGPNELKSLFHPVGPLYTMLRFAAYATL